MSKFASLYDIKSFIAIAIEKESVYCFWLSLTESRTAYNDSLGIKDIGNRYPIQLVSNITSLCGRHVKLKNF